MALIAAVTLVVGAVPVGTELVQVTVPAPDGPATWSGIEAVGGSPELPSVAIRGARVSVLEPTVSVQLPVPRCAVAPLAPVAAGLAKARYDGPAGNATVVTL